jgi:ribosomal protein L7Ae-like RNA K-turn-binding protein
VKGTSAPSDAAARLAGGLGLAARAGRLRVGIEAVTRAVARREAVAVIIAADASRHARRKLEALLARRALPYRVALDGERLARAIGRRRVVALAVTDASLGRRILELAEAVGG